MQWLKPNEVIELEMTTGHRRRYRVEETRIADSRNAWIGSTQDQAQLMMVTCYPFDAVQPGGPLRYVVTARADVDPS